MAHLSRRLPTNVAGDFFVDATCIDCGTCRWMAPSTFDREAGHSRVHRQPTGADETTVALKALVSCPTASIGTVELHDVAAVARGFPDPVGGGVYHCGYHHPGSYGAASYLIVRPGGNVMVDVPRFAAPLVARIEEMGGIGLMFLSHRDDIAGHEKFAHHFGCRRVMHVDDVDTSTGDIEWQPDGRDPFELAPDLTMIPVPGHTRG